MPIDESYYMCHYTFQINVHSFLTAAASLPFLFVPGVGLFEQNCQPRGRATSRIKSFRINTCRNGPKSCPNYLPRHLTSVDSKKTYGMFKSFRYNTYKKVGGVPVIVNYKFYWECGSLPPLFHPRTASPSLPSATIWTISIPLA